MRISQYTGVVIITLTPEQLYTVISLLEKKHTLFRRNYNPYILDIPLLEKLKFTPRLLQSADTGDSFQNYK